MASSTRTPAGRVRVLVLFVLFVLLRGLLYEAIEVSEVSGFFWRNGDANVPCAVLLLFKKNLNASKPSEHPLQVEECLKVFAGVVLRRNKHKKYTGKQTSSSSSSQSSIKKLRHNQIFLHSDYR